MEYEDVTNELHEKSLTKAISLATAIFRNRRCDVEQKRDLSCTDLVLLISGLQREIGRLTDDARRLEDEAEDLRRQGALDLGFAALSALAGLAGAARGVALGARMIASRSARSLTRQDVLDLLSLFGPIGAALQSVKAALEIAEAARLERMVDDLIERGERLGQELLDLVDEYEASGCGPTDNLRS